MSDGWDWKATKCRSISFLSCIAYSSRWTVYFCRKGIGGNVRDFIDFPLGWLGRNVHAKKNILLIQDMIG